MEELDSTMFADKSILEGETADSIQLSERDE